MSAPAPSTGDYVSPHGTVPPGGSTGTCLCGRALEVVERRVWTHADGKNYRHRTECVSEDARSRETEVAAALAQVRRAVGDDPAALRGVAATLVELAGRR